jgi:RNA polymerase sigma-70 factor, ECF subfamily
MGPPPTGPDHHRPSPPEERDVAAFVQAAQAGDREALEALLHSQINRIHGLCRRMCGPDAEDATQEALLAIVKGLPRFDGRSAFSTWVHRVATNAALDELRRRGRRPMVVRRIDSAPGEPDPSPRALDPADPAPGADDRLPDRLAIDEALASLPEEFRVPVVLRDHLGLDYAEIADVLGLPPGTVRSRIARGRGRLADMLVPADDSGNPRYDDDVQGRAT